MADEVVSVDFKYEPTVDFGQFEEEIHIPLQNLPEIDSATVGYMGETTLAANIDSYLDILRNVKAKLKRDDYGPLLSIFTNSTTLQDDRVRAVLAKFDLVMAKLDCARQLCLRKVNRPHPSVPPVEEIIKNIAKLRVEMEQYPGHQLAVQTLLFKSLNPKLASNTSEEDLLALAAAYETIKPHLVQIYTVAREPAEKGIHALSSKDKDEIRAFFETHVKDGAISIHVY